MRERLRRLAKLESVFHVGEEEGRPIFMIVVSPGPNGNEEGQRERIGQVGETLKPGEIAHPVTREMMREVFANGSKMELTE
jgi:hypothetical protein